MKKTVLVTGASSGFGQMISYALAEQGYIVYASMRQTKGRNSDKVEAAAAASKERGISLRTIELDVQDDVSVDAAVKAIIADTGQIDILVHNAGHMVLGPAEAFTPEVYAEQYDVNVISTQRVNRAVLPHMRSKRSGLLIWISSTSVKGGVPPYLAPYFAAKAAMESLAVSYAAELTPWGIETSIVTPGVYTSGTNHFQNSGRPDDLEVLNAYEAGPTSDLNDRVAKGHDAILPDDADPLEVALKVVEVANMPFGTRPFHVTIDPADMGYEVVAMMGDRVRAEVFWRMDIEDLLKPSLQG